SKIVPGSSKKNSTGFRRTKTGSQCFQPHISSTGGSNEIPPPDRTARGYGLSQRSHRRGVRSNRHALKSPGRVAFSLGRIVRAIAPAPSAGPRGPRPRASQRPGYLSSSAARRLRNFAKAPEDLFGPPHHRRASIFSP